LQVTYIQPSQSLAQLGLVQTRNLQQQLEEGRHEARLSQQLQVQLPPRLHQLQHLSTGELEGVVVPVLDFDLLLVVEGQFENPLLFGAGEILDQEALVVVLESNAAQLLLQFAIFQSGFVLARLLVGE
jgi:hypothetical protein